MDNDFMGDIEFKLTPQEGVVVNEAINLAAQQRETDFSSLNPLITIMQWWQANHGALDTNDAGAEARLVKACRQYIDAHMK